MSNQVAMQRAQHSKRSSKSQGRRNQVRIDIYDVAMRLCMALNTPCSLKVYLLLKNKEYTQIARLGIDPRDYTDNKLPHLGHPGLATFMADHQCTSLLAKYEELDTGIDTELVAKKKFIDCEWSCKQTNERLRAGGIQKMDVSSVITLMTRKISSILGPVPTFASMRFTFGPGANYGVRGETSSYNKLTSALECTYTLTGIAPEFLGEFPGWVPNGAKLDLTVVSGSRLTFVPKNAKTDRPICIEPLLNGLYQKGVGSYIRDRLKRFSYDLRDQTVNQVMAQKAYLGSLATVDFASASDTIAYATVLELLPIDWFEFLDVARSPCFEIDGRVYPFQKFSSMGNAYTFELESLIFATLAEATCEVLNIPYRLSGPDRNVSVYGDDVIIPSAAYDLFSEVASSLGFSINTEKTFTNGLFFESCGKDYFTGTDVRPFQIKKHPSKKPGALGVFYVANSIKRWASKFAEVDLLGLSHRALVSLHRRIVDLVPDHRKLYGPDGFGDGHFIADTFDVSYPNLERGWEGYVFRTLVELPVLHLPSRDADDLDDMLGDSSPCWPMAYALYNSAYGSDAVNEFYASLYDSKTSCPAWWRRVIESNVKHSLGYMVRGRTRVKEVAVDAY